MLLNDKSTLSVSSMPKSDWIPCISATVLSNSSRVYILTGYYNIHQFDPTFLSLLLSEAGKLSTLREFQNKTASVILSSRPIIV